VQFDASTFLADFHRDDRLLHILGVRRVIEPTAAAMATIRNSDELTRFWRWRPVTCSIIRCADPARSEFRSGKSQVFDQPEQAHQRGTPERGRAPVSYDRRPPTDG
jgi:hypothetical protein